jgi:glycosyl transferase family 1/MatE protein
MRRREQFERMPSIMSRTSRIGIITTRTSCPRSTTAAWSIAARWAARPAPRPSAPPARALLHLINFDEPFGLSAVEALASGTPVIASNRGSMPELIGHGVTGFLVDNVDDRANALVFHAFLLALALGAIFAGLMLLGGPTLFRLMGGQDDMLDAALAYANVALGGAAAICILNFMGNAVRGTGNMALPAGVLVACVLAHIAISPILIFGFGPLPPLGAAGAAWASCCRSRSAACGSSGTCTPGARSCG